MKRQLPSPLTILMFVIVIAAIATWLIPAGKYDTIAYQEDGTFLYHTETKDTTLRFSQPVLDSLGIRIPAEKFSNGDIKKPISVPGTYKKSVQKPQSFLQIIQAPIKGVYDSIEIVFFIMIIGGFMHVFNSTGAMIKGLTALSYRMKGKEAWLIILLTFLFSFAGSSYGMAEEALVFYAVLVPLFLAAGYDLLVPVAVIFAGTQLGTLSSFSNPFSTIIASNAAGIKWTDGMIERIIMFILTTASTIIYIVRYAMKIKADPTKSIVYKIDGNIKSPFSSVANNVYEKVSGRDQLLIITFVLSFLIMITGVIFWDWWLLEMTTIFIVAALLMAIISKMKERVFIPTFVTGAQELFNVALIVGIARGVTIILNDGKISDSILYYAAKASSGLPPAIFIIALLFLYIFLTLFISSSSGMAVLTMPIIGSLATLVHVPGREIVNAYLFGMGIMGFLTPTGLILPSLALVGVSLKAWWRFIYPLLIILMIICIICLVIGVYL